MKNVCAQITHIAIQTADNIPVRNTQVLHICH